MPFDNDNINSVPVDFDGFGLNSDNEGRQGEDGGNGIGDFWNDDRTKGLRDNLGLKNKPQNNDSEGISQSEFEQFMQFKEAVKAKNPRALFKLAGMDGAEALTALPGVMQDDQVATLSQSLEQLKAENAQMREWVETQKKQSTEQEKSAKTEQAKARVKELFARDEFALINEYEQFDSVWEAGREFAQKHKRPPSKTDWMNLAVLVENSLRDQARSIREKQIPVEKLDLQSILGGNSDAKPPINPTSDANTGYRPTLNNGGSPQVRPAQNDDGILDRDQRRARALEAARRYRG